METLKLPLSENQQRVFRYINEYVQVHGYPPLNKEIQEALSFSNPGTIHKCISALENKGWLERTKGRHRGIIVEGSNI